jgi:glycosidase
LPAQAVPDYENNPPSYDGHDITNHLSIDLHLGPNQDVIHLVDGRIS